MVNSGWKRGPAAAYSLTFGSLLLASGCADLFDFERATSIVQCINDGDCENGLVCASNLCTACTSDCSLATYALPQQLPPASPAIANFQVTHGDDDESELFGIQIHLVTEAVLVSIGIVTSYSGPNGYLGLYQDENGGPTTRLATTSQFALKGDPMVDNDPVATEVPVETQVTLAPGYYWILGDFDQSVFVQLSQGQIGCHQGDPACPIGCVQGDPDCTKWYVLPQLFGPVPSTIVGGQFQYLPVPVMYVNLEQ